MRYSYRDERNRERQRDRERCSKQDDDYNDKESAGDDINVGERAKLNRVLFGVIGSDWDLVRPNNAPSPRLLASVTGASYARVWEP